MVAALTAAEPEPNPGIPLFPAELARPLLTEAAGLITADGFENLRALIDPKRRRGEGQGRNARPRHSAGRWALLRTAPATPEKVGQRR